MKTALSTEYPKWLYKKGDRPIKVLSIEEENKHRESGYSHEFVSEPAAPQPSVEAQSGTQQPGMVPTSVMDATIEGVHDSWAKKMSAQAARFDKSWADKCAAFDYLSNIHTQLQVDHDALLGEHGALKDAHKALLDQNANLIAAQELAKAATTPAAETAKPKKG